MQISQRHQRYLAGRVSEVKMFITQKMHLKQFLSPHHMEDVKRGSNNIIVEY